MNAKSIKVDLPTDTQYILSAGNLYRIIASGAQTNSRFSLIFSILKPGQGGPIHTHSNEQESFYITKGSLTFYDGQKEVLAPEGSFVFCPEGASRGFRNNTDNDVEMLILYTPSGIENMIKMDGTPINSLKRYKHEHTEQLACPVLNEQFGIEEIKTPLL
ncbi:cupin domain-containing protein [Pseudoalteromonas luteoviolacea]|uniref:cupin domain-containing protein n=1 Tax=Pseudoalteromonas luteoviolacea TaxID=43657 RepID=UPI001B35D57B|nr:cupin domain-containing protein [Pseudoalteromonas luteoviolacea]MBQ4810786.1 cupin domain-containing protein [Pseudoalteromonas luteoviolacea]